MTPQRIPIDRLQTGVNALSAIPGRQTQFASKFIQYVKATTTASLWLTDRTVWIKERGQACVTCQTRAEAQWIFTLLGGTLT